MPDQGVPHGTRMLSSRTPSVEWGAPGPPSRAVEAVSGLSFSHGLWYSRSDWMAGEGRGTGRASSVVYSRDYLTPPSSARPAARGRPWALQPLFHTCPGSRSPTWTFPWAPAEPGSLASPETMDRAGGRVSGVPSLDGERGGVPLRSGSGGARTCLFQFEAPWAPACSASFHGSEERGTPGKRCGALSGLSQPSLTALPEHSRENATF